MGQNKIDEIFGLPDIEGQVGAVRKLVQGIRTDIETFPKIKVLVQNSEGPKQLADANKQLSTVLDQLKLKNAELTVAQKQLNLEMAQARVEAQKRVVELRAQAAEEKKMRQEEQVAGQERILQLRKEQQQVQDLADAETALRTAEQNRLQSGFTNTRAQIAPVAGVSEPLVKVNVDQQNILDLKNYQNRVKELAAEEKALKAAFDNGGMSLNAYRLKLADLSEKTNLYKKAVSDTAKTIMLNTNVNNAERNSLERAQALILQYTNAKKGLNLATEEGRLLNENYNKAIANTNKFLKANGDEVTKQAKNVGNYGSVFTKAFSGLRTLANILPGIGIGGIVAFAIEPIVNWINAVKKATGDAKLFADAFEAAAKGSAAEVATLDVFKNKLNDLSKPANDRIKIAKEYNTVAAEGNKINLEEINNLTAINDQINKQILLIEKQALAKAAQGQIAKFADKEIEAQLKLNQALAAAGVTEKDVSDAIAAGIQVQDKERDKASRNLDGYNQKVLLSDKVFAKTQKDNITTAKNINAELRTLFTIKESAATDLQRVVRLLSNSIADDSIVDPKKDKVDKTKNSTKALLDGDFELYKVHQQEKLKVLGQIRDDEESSLSERLSAQQAFIEASKELNDRQLQNDLAALRQKKAAQEINVSKAKGTEKDNLIIELKNTNTAIEVLEAKHQVTENEIIRDGEAKSLDIVEKVLSARFKAKKDAYEMELKLAEQVKDRLQAGIDTQYQQDLTDLKFALDTKQITQKEYDDKRERLQLAFQIESLNNEIAFAEKALAIQKLAGIDTSKRESALAKLKTDLVDLVANHTKKANENALKEDKDFTNKKKELYKKLASELIQTLASFHLNSIQQEQDELDERKRLLDEDTQRRISNINLLGLSEVERVRQTAMVEKEAAFQSEQIEARKRKLAQDRAKFEKAQSIASIITGTAQAIVSALGMRPYTPANITLAALTGAIGAVQLARAIATPIPKYAQGRGKGKSEFAWVGDGGVSEYIWNSNTGTIRKTADTPTITHLVPDDVVFKNESAMARAMVGANKAYTGIYNKDGVSHTGNNINRRDVAALIQATKDIKPKVVLVNRWPMELTPYYYQNIKK